MVNHTKASAHAARLLLPAAACLLAAGLTALLLLRWHDRQQLALLDGFCTALVRRAPETADAVYDLAKSGAFSAAGPGVLAGLGYEPEDFSAGAAPVLAALAAALTGGLLWGAARCLQRRRFLRRLDGMIRLLGAARAGKPLPLWDRAEDPLAPLADEIGKTVTELARTREAAVAARDRFAQSLADIAHQLKTPLTALSLAAQGAGEPTRGAMLPQITRLTGLEEALLLLARLDSGALPLHPVPTDLFTLLTMAADPLQSLARRAGVALDVPEQGAIPVEADPDWTVEALMNLMKNCLEHTPPGGAVRCRYARNALYTEVCIEDEGAGFAKADLPHLFERFYRGANAAPGSTGIGLSIAKELLERQNAVLTAENHPAGGRFRVRFYAQRGPC